MNILITPLSQRDIKWKDQRLGTKNGTTIGSDGCVVTSASMMYTHYGKPTTPDQLDNFLTDNKLYYDETGDGSANDNLWVPQNVSRWLAGIKFDRIVVCKTTPAPIGEIKAYLDQGKPVFVWLINNGVFHCTLAVGYEGNEIIVNDPWRGDTVRIDQRWGNSAEKILEVDFYTGQKVNTDLQECLRQHADLLKQLDTANTKLALTEQDNKTQLARIKTLETDLLASNNKLKPLQDRVNKLESYAQSIKTLSAGV